MASLVAVCIALAGLCTTAFSSRVSSNAALSSEVEEHDYDAGSDTDEETESAEEDGERETKRTSDTLASRAKCCKCGQASSLGQPIYFCSKTGKCRKCKNYGGRKKATRIDASGACSEGKINAADDACRDAFENSSPIPELTRAYLAPRWRKYSHPLVCAGLIGKPSRWEASGGWINGSAVKDRRNEIKPEDLHTILFSLHPHMTGAARLQECQAVCSRDANCIAIGIERTAFHATCRFYANTSGSTCYGAGVLNAYLPPGEQNQDFYRKANVDLDPEYPTDDEIRARIEELENYTRQLERNQIDLDSKIAKEPYNEELKAQRMMLTETHVWLDVTFPFAGLAEKISGVNVFKDTSRKNFYNRSDSFFEWMQVRNMVSPGGGWPDYAQLLPNAPPNAFLGPDSYKTHSVVSLLPQVVVRTFSTSDFGMCSYTQYFNEENKWEKFVCSCEKCPALLSGIPGVLGC